MALTKKNYVDLTGLSTFKSSLLGTVINDTNKTTTSKTATIKAIADYVDSEVEDLSSAVTAELAKKVSSVTYDSTNKKLVYNKGGSTNTDIVTVATLKSAIGNFGKSGTGASAGLVPAPSTTAGTSKYLREDGTWVTPPNTTYSVFGKSGSTASTGLVPKPSTTAGTSKYLREDGTWVTPPDTNTTYTNATASQAGLMGADDKAKLNSIATGAEVNQNAFSNVKIGDVTVSADSKTDTLTLVAGSNVTITPDATNDKITIASSYVNTTYSAGTDLSLSGTTFNHANSSVTAGTYRSVTVNARGHVTGGTNPTTLSGYGITDAKISNGIITLGSGTITPLTKDSTLAAGKVSGTLATSNIPNLDASKITTGTINVDRLPATALERCVVVADDTARFKLTTASVQVGDTVKVTATKKMYMVVDSSNLSSAAGYEEYFTSTDWSTITNKPSSYTPSSHTHDDRYYTETEVNNLLANKANTFSVSSSNNTASWGSAVTVGTVAGTSLTFTMPANPNTDTHYTAKNVVASSSTETADVTAATDNPYVNLIENGTVRSTHRISGSGATTVKTDTSGNIIISSTNTTYTPATQSANGLMSSTDKTKLDGIDIGANKTVVDSSLSSTSTNPVQNKAVYSALSGKANSSHTHDTAGITGLQSYVDERIEVAVGDINAILDRINGEVV